MSDLGERARKRLEQSPGRFLEAASAVTPGQGDGVAQIIVDLDKKEGRDEFLALLDTLSTGSLREAKANLVETLAVSDAEKAHAAGDRGGFGKFLMRAFHRNICGDPAKRKEVQAAIDEAAKNGGMKLTTPAAANLSVGAASIIAVSVGAALGPATALALAAAPFAGGVSLFLMQVGIDAFCEWSAELDS